MKSIIKVKCNCDCHTSKWVMHMMACCNNGFAEQEIEELYYTPKIEEFHVGFEHEVFEIPFGISKTEKDGKWEKGSLPHPGFFQEINWKAFVEAIEEKHVRVKYLDQEGIESLGWTPSKDTPGVYDLGNWALRHFKDTSTVSIIERDLVKSKNYMTIGAPSTVMHIVVKNKSELKRILKQLNITDEL